MGLRIAALDPENRFKGCVEKVSISKEGSLRAIPILIIRCERGTREHKITTTGMVHLCNQIEKRSPKYSHGITEPLSHLGTRNTYSQ